jgi:NDP-sugar pyrophosphorylase family protein
MESLILVGGAGRRLRGVIGADLPKPMAPIGGRPFLAWLLDQLRDAGCRDVWLLTGHRGDIIEGYVGSGAAWGLHVRYSQEPEPLGTGGALRYAWPGLSSDTCLVMNGDSYLAAPLADLIGSHDRSGAVITMALASVADTRRYGSVAVGPDGLVTAFREKEDAPIPRPGLINAGVLVMDTSLLGTLPADRPVSLEQEVLPALVDGRVRGVVYQVPFVDIGVPESYTALDADPGAVLPAAGAIGT